jgi:hypothetical protein
VSCRPDNGSPGCRHGTDGRVYSCESLQKMSLGEILPTFSRNSLRGQKMFKRVDKRRRKKEEEDKLGLDEEVKEILGIQDTDSEESVSDSDSDSDEGQQEEESVADEEMNSGEDDDDEEEDEEEDPSITVGQALKDPLYNVSVLPDIKACIVCPGKLLKSIRMVQLHRTSNACTLSLI